MNSHVIQVHSIPGDVVVELNLFIGPPGQWQGREVYVYPAPREAVPEPSPSLPLYPYVFPTETAFKGAHPPQTAT